MTTYISVACSKGEHTDDDLPNGSLYGSIPPCSCKCHTTEAQVRADNTMRAYDHMDANGL